MTYIAQHPVDAGDVKFAPGAEVPEEFVDASMIEAGSVADGKVFVGPYDNLTRKELFALCEAHEIEAPERSKVAELRELLLADDSGIVIGQASDHDESVEGE